MNIFESRRSIRKYDENYKISKEKLTEIITLAQRAPSSMNLQPTRLLVVESKEYKNKLKNALYGNQLQLETSSAMIIVLTDLNKFSEANYIFDEAVKNNIMPESVRQDQLKKIDHITKHVTKEKILQDGLLDAGLFSMQLMLVAKSYGYDTCAIGGFNKDKLKEEFKLEDNLEPALIISIGKNDEEGYPSYRLPINKITKFL